MWTAIILTTALCLLTTSNGFAIEKTTPGLPNQPLTTTLVHSLTTIDNDSNDDAASFPFHLLKSHWQVNPVLIRKAFTKTWSIFSWDDVLDMAFDDDTESSARLIRHVPGQLDSFDLQLAPFDKRVQRAFHKSKPKLSKTYKQTILVNDVDRSISSLADWLDDSFGSLPRWRRDDAQVSLAHTGGGIGPHVDQYDVLLMQVSGQREWLIDAQERLSPQQEQNRLIPDLSVRILQQPTNDNEDRYTRIVLEPGDCLYLPPRVVHWGTALSDQCITLSVGTYKSSRKRNVHDIAYK